MIGAVTLRRPTSVNFNADIGNVFAVVTGKAVGNRAGRLGTVAFGLPSFQKASRAVQTEMVGNIVALDNFRVTEYTRPSVFTHAVLEIVMSVTQLIRVGSDAEIIDILDALATSTVAVTIQSAGCLLRAVNDGRGRSVTRSGRGYISVENKLARESHGST